MPFVCSSPALPLTKNCRLRFKAPNAASRVAIAEANEIINGRRTHFATADDLLNALEEASRK